MVLQKGLAFYLFTL